MLRPTALLSLLLVLDVAPTYAAPAGAGWRELPLDETRVERLDHELTRALRARWGKRLKDFRLRFTGPRLVTDGAEFRARFDSFTVLARRWYLGDLPVQGRIDFGAAELDYARLGVSELAILGEVRGRAHVRIDHAGLSELLAEGGFQDVGYQWEPETEEFVLWGYRPIHLLFFRVRPRVKIRLQVHLDGTVLRFRRIQIYISSIPRFIERILERRISRKLGQRIELQDDFDKLARQGVRVEGGVVEILGVDDREVLRLEVPGDPTLAPAEPPVAAPRRGGPLVLE